ncbi:MAG: YeeE/YedE family protein [Gammaproteobacteria bacterium]|nr:YeeE/YedE family protein [Gammaproteobacteria bacterium]
MIEPGSIPAALVGGAVIGLAAALMLAVNGRILGVSGIAAGMIAAGTSGSERLLRGAFLLGMLVGGLAIGRVIPQALPGALTSNHGVLALAGLAVGFGTRLGGGCTSGHGVCGMARLSPRSLVATGVFMAAGFATVFVIRHVLGGLS